MSNHLQTAEMTKENLDSPAAAEMLATIAVASLKQYGQVSFILRPDGGVAFANPVHVYFHPQSVEDLGGRPYRFVRPIVGAGKPNFVLWRDGILWEVEPEDGQLQDQPQEKPGG